MMDWLYIYNVLPQTHNSVASSMAGFLNVSWICIFSSSSLSPIVPVFSPFVFFFFFNMGLECTDIPGFKKWGWVPLESRPWTLLGQHNGAGSEGKGMWEQEAWPNPSQAAAFRRVGFAPWPGNTVELALETWVPMSHPEVTSVGELTMPSVSIG